ncbi:DUF21 domain-containing protein [bacterium]|nr:DUF21 domain-containing protein [bacterium]
MKLVALVILLAFSAFFSGSETAFFSLGRFDVQRMALKRERWAEKVVSLLSRPGKLLIAILSGNMIVNITATTLMTGFLIQLVGPGAVPIVVAIMTVLILIFGEITPKVIAVEHNELWARVSASALWIIEFILSPLIFLLTIIQSAIIGKGKFDDLRLDEIDIESAIELAHKQGAVEGEYKELLLHFLTLDHTKVSEIMTPRPQVPICSYESTKKEILESMHEYDAIFCILTGRSEDKPRLIDVSDLSSFDNEEKPWSSLREAYFIAGLKAVSDLFYDLRANRLGKFIVLDEYGDIDGIVDSERILIEVYGRPIIYEKPSKKTYKKLGESYLIGGDTSIQELNELFGLDLKSVYYKTIGGLIIENWGDIPESGRTLEIEGLEIRIIKSSHTKIDLVGIKIE